MSLQPKMQHCAPRFDITIEISRALGVTVMVAACLIIFLVKNDRLYNPVLLRDQLLVRPSRFQISNQGR